MIRNALKGLLVITFLGDAVVVAQDIGDTVIVLRNAPMKVGTKTLGTIHLGSTIEIKRAQD